MNEADPARARFLIIQMLRLSGVALAVLGAAILAGKIALPELAGYLFLFVGVVDALFAPPLLARIWRTPMP
jgi:hypothetical protein